MLGLRIAIISLLLLTLTLACGADPAEPAGNSNGEAPEAASSAVEDLDRLTPLAQPAVRLAGGESADARIEVVRVVSADESSAVEEARERIGGENEPAGPVVEVRTREARWLNEPAELTLPLEPSAAKAVAAGEAELRVATLVDDEHWLVLAKRPRLDAVEGRPVAVVEVNHFSKFVAVVRRAVEGVREVALLPWHWTYRLHDESNWLAAAKQDESARPDDVVIFIHGLDSANPVWNTMAAALDDTLGDGWELMRFQYPNDDTVSRSAALLARELKRLCEAVPHTRIHIVAHSMGGLVSRYALEHLDPGENVASLTMLGTPNHGSALARLQVLLDVREHLMKRSPLSASFGPLAILLDGNGEAAKDLEPGSALLHTLNPPGWQAPAETDYLVVAGTRSMAPLSWTGLAEATTGSGDGVVTVSSATLPGVPLRKVARNHTELPSDSSVIRFVGQRLTALAARAAQQGEDLVAQDADDAHTEVEPLLRLAPKQPVGDTEPEPHVRERLGLVARDLGTLGGTVEMRVTRHGALHVAEVLITGRIFEWEGPERLVRVRPTAGLLMLGVHHTGTQIRRDAVTTTWRASSDGPWQNVQARSRASSAGESVALLHHRLAGVPLPPGMDPATTERVNQFNQLLPPEQRRAGVRPVGRQFADPDQFHTVAVRWDLPDPAANERGHLEQTVRIRIPLHVTDAARLPLLRIWVAPVLDATLEAEDASQPQQPRREQVQRLHEVEAAPLADGTTPTVTVFNVRITGQLETVRDTYNVMAASGWIRSVGNPLEVVGADASPLWRGLTVGVASHVGLAWWFESMCPNQVVSTLSVELANGVVVERATSVMGRLGRGAYTFLLTPESSGGYSTNWLADGVADMYDNQEAVSRLIRWSLAGPLEDGRPLTEYAGE